MKKIMMISLVILLTLAGWLQAATIDESQFIVITLPETYTIPQDDQKIVRLGEVASSITAADENTKKKYEALVVLNAPAPGEQTRLPNHYIIQTIRKAGLDGFNVRFVGERVVEIYGYGKVFDIQDIIQKMRKQVLGDTGWEEDELVLRILSVPPHDLRIPDEKVEVVLDRTSPMIYGTVRFEVRLFIDDVQYKSFPIIASIAHRRVAYMPTRALNRGDVIAAEDIREVTHFFDQEFLDRQAVENSKDIIGSKCKTPIKQGDLIKWNHLDVNYVVNRGDLVNLVVLNNGMTMQTTGKALKRGAIGDIVLVKAEKTNLVVKARVIKRGLVELVTL